MKEMKWIVLSSCLLFTMFIGHGRACERGVFGLNCTNQCHCRSGECTEFGACEDGCEDGWGGIHCNYRDAAFNTTSPLTDNDRTTCLDSTPNALYIFRMREETKFTWMRISLKKKNLLDDVLIFYEDSSSIPVYPNFTRTIFDGNNVYLFGSRRRKFKTIKIRFLRRASKKHFCDMFVSGGRNVAFKQPASISTTCFPDCHIANTAVDGFRDNGHCVSTKPESNAWLLLKPRLPVDVNYIEIYNSDVLSCRLKYFKLWMLRKSEVYRDRGSRFNVRMVERYSDSQRETQMVYKVVARAFKPVDSIGLTVDPYYWVNENRSSCGDSPHENVLAVCEVEVYGEVRCPVGRYGYDCEKKCDSNCVLGCQVETGYCNKCAKGRSGAFCQIIDYVVGRTCERGAFGLNCTNQCHCRSGYCIVFGNCIPIWGCEDGWGGIHCSYHDAAFDDSSPLTDNDRATCLDSTPNDVYIFRMREETKLTWIRFNLKKKDVFDNDDDVRILFNDNSYQTITPTFLRKIVDGYTVDFIGSMDKRFRYIVLVFKSPAIKQYFCGMFVSGGRNVAFKQPVSLQTEWRENREAEKAVDGVRDASECVHTRAGEPEMYHTLSITPRLPIDVNFIEIYTGDDPPCKLKLYRMFLHSGAKWNSTVQRYYDYRSETPNLVKVLATTFEPISQISLTGQTYVNLVEGRRRKVCGPWQYPYRIMVCELEVYGEVRCPVGQYGYDCEKTCDSDCVSGCHVETGYCNQCAKGRSGRYCEI